MPSFAVTNKLFAHVFSACRPIVLGEFPPGDVPARHVSRREANANANDAKPDAAGWIGAFFDAVFDVRRNEL